MGNAAAKRKRLEEAQAAQARAAVASPRRTPREPEAPLEHVVFRVVGLGTCPEDFEGLFETEQANFRMYDRSVTFEMETPQRNEDEAIVDGHFVTPSFDHLQKYTEDKDFCFVSFDPFDATGCGAAELMLKRIEDSMSSVGLISVGNLSKRDLGARDGKKNYGKEVGEEISVSVRYIEVREESNNHSHWGDVLYLLAGNMLSDDGLGGRAVKRARH